MHLPRSYLNFKRYALSAYYRGVKRLIHIGFGGGNIIFKSARNRGKHIVNNTKAVIAVYDLINNYSDGIDVVYFVKAFVLHIHFAVYAVNAFYSALNVAIGHNLFNSLGNLPLYLLKIFAPRLLLLCERSLNLVISYRVKVAYGKVFEFFFHRSDT